MPGPSAFGRTRPGSLSRAVSLLVLLASLLSPEALAQEPPADPGPPAEKTADVVVTASQLSFGEGDGSSRRVLTREEMERLPNLGDDPFRLVSQLPGATASDYSAAFHVRGGEERELLVRLDGLVLDKPFHLRGFLSAATILDPKAIAGIEVLSGGAPAPYGRLSAVMNLTTRTPGRRRFILGVSLVSFSAYAEGTFADGKGRAVVSARRGFLDLALRLTDAGLDEELDPRFADAYARVERSLGAAHTLTFSGLWAGDDLGFHDTGQEATSKTSDLYGSGVLRSALSARLVSEAAVEAGRVSTNRDGTVAGGGVNGTFHDDRALRFAGTRLAVDWDVAPRHALRLGGALRAQDATYDHLSSRTVTDPYLLALGVPARQRLDFAPSPSGNEWSLFASDRIAFSPRVGAEAGLRVDGATWSGSAHLLPRLGLAVTAGARSTLRAAWGLFSQPQGLDELYPEENSYEYYPDAEAEHRVLAFDTSFASGLSLRLEAWQKVYRSLPARWENLFDPIESIPELQGDRVRVAPTGGDARGLELLGRYDRGMLGLFVAYTLSRATDRLALEDVPRGWDQTHALNASAVFRPGPRSSIAATLLLHTGWPYTEPLLVSGVPALGPRNGTRHPAYHRLDVRASHRFPLGKGSLRAYIEVMNLYDRRNECCVESVRWRRPAGAAPYLDVRYETWIGRLPSFGVEWEF